MGIKKKDYLRRMEKKKHKHISKEQRYQISILLKAGHKVRDISIKFT